MISKMEKVSVSMVIVDPKPSDYADLLRQCGDQGRSVFFVSSGRAALWLGSVDAWIVYVDLPDMSGFELSEMIRSRFPNTRILLIGEDYSMEGELRARCGSGAAYTCKPFPVQWVSDWLRLAGEEKKAA